MRPLKRFWRDQGGGAAIEMAIVTPVIAGLALVSAEVWMMSMDKQKAATALEAASDYYMSGGLSDEEAVDVAMAAWSDAPQDGEVSPVRSGRCGIEAADISELCADGSTAAIYVTLTAHGTSQGLFEPRGVEAERTVRVR